MPENRDQLTIHTNGNADDLFELLEWFNDSDDLRGRVVLPTKQILPGEMGGLSDVLVVSLGAGGALTALVSSLTTWFTVRRSDIAITLKTGPTSEITIDAKRVTLPEVTASLQTMLEQLDNGQ
ncbi:effector-associated constant component EACC1 [Nocardia rhamnosiphila]